MRNLILFFGSLFFYAWGEPVYVVLMLVSVLCGYAAGRGIGNFLENGRKTAARAVLAAAMVFAVGLLVIFKYTGWYSLPLGISFYTFQLLSYVADVYRGEEKPQKSLIKFGAYISMFPQLIAGPIVRYQEIESELNAVSEDVQGRVEQSAAGVRRFVLGLGKKALLANQAGLLWEQLSALSGNGLTAGGAWLGILAFAFQIYFDFSGYSDMAIGLGAVLGFSFPENFRYPYIAASVTEFWRRWHMTLGRWFRDYVYIPLGGSRKGLGRQMVNLLAVWMLTGIWHGRGLQFLLWGLWFALLLMAEKAAGAWQKKRRGDFPGKEKKIWWKHGIGMLYTFFAVLMGWVLFAQDSPEQAFDWWRVMFSFGGSAESIGAQTAVFLAGNYRMLLICCALGATPLPAAAVRSLRTYGQERLGKNMAEKVFTAAEGVFLMLVFALCLAFIVEDSYNPFLYFRF